MKAIILFVSSALMALILSSCSDTNCGTNLEVSESLLRAADERKYDYCDLLKASISGSANSVRQFSLCRFPDGISYEHGAVLIDVLDQLSESKYLNIIHFFVKDQRNIVYYSLLAGFDSTQNPKFKGKSLNDAFPKLYVFLRSE